MSQHPVIFIGLLRCYAAVLSDASLDREKVKNRHADGKIETSENICKRIPFHPDHRACDRQN